jgi:hypothetical protein
MKSDGKPALRSGGMFAEGWWPPSKHFKKLKC